VSRLTFPPELQQRITKELIGKGMEENVVRSALKAWNSMAEPSTPVQVGCFQFFDQLAVDAEIESGEASYLQRRQLPIKTLSESEEFAALERMKKYGGGFVSALAEAWTHADQFNRHRLRCTFSDYLMQYHEMREKNES
jgi:hypothetical protein